MDLSFAAGEHSSTSSTFLQKLRLIGANGYVGRYVIIQLLFDEITSAL